MGTPNDYGLGLQNFHLGYLYEKYAYELAKEQTQTHFKEVAMYDSVCKYEEVARKHYREAYTHFDTMMHLKGMYLAKWHEAGLYMRPSGVSGSDPEDDSSFVQKRALKDA